ncbi:unnamed protein product [Urochloa humidicola]
MIPFPGRARLTSGRSRLTNSRKARSGMQYSICPEVEWKARLLMEQSSAVKCPSISYHLVGTKKIEQELAKPNVFERFLDNEDIAKLPTSFTGLWSLDNEEIVETAIEKLDFVLKPQNEKAEETTYKVMICEIR